jgi:hypothetical protein
MDLPCLHYLREQGAALSRDSRLGLARAVGVLPGTHSPYSPLPSPSPYSASSLDPAPVPPPPPGGLPRYPTLHLLVLLGTLVVPLACITGTRLVLEFQVLWMARCQVQLLQFCPGARVPLGYPGLCEQPEMSN